MAVFIASILGSFHCAAMCGGVALACSTLSSHPCAAQVAYHGGRLLTYALLGFLGGLIGARANWYFAPHGLHEIAAWSMGTLLILWGAGQLFTSRSTVVGGARRFALSISNFFAQCLRDASQTVGGNSVGTARSSLQLHALLLGASTAFLPCGWLYSFVAVAIATGSPVAGAGVMVAFWLGTLPVLSSLGLVAQLAGDAFMRHAPRISAGLMIVAGLLAIFGHVYSFPFSTRELLHASHQQVEGRDLGPLCVP
jgi:sulfite exporter TauE/SafE